MAYDQYQAERVFKVLKRKKVAFDIRKMMGGLCIMVDDKMCIGLLQDKVTQGDVLMVRIGEASYATVIGNHHVKPMDFTGRPMKGYAFVAAEGFDMEEDLDRWIDLCLEYNPHATRSKKKKKKSTE